jgi:hypothetical protein
MAWEEEAREAAARREILERGGSSDMSQTFRSFLERCELEKLNPLSSWPRKFTKRPSSPNEEQDRAFGPGELLLKLSSEELGQEIEYYGNKIYPAGAEIDDKNFLWWATSSHIGGE